MLSPLTKIAPFLTSARGLVVSAPPRRETRIRVALAVGLGIFIISLIYRISIQEGYGDLNWPLCAAATLREGQDPYAVCGSRPGPMSTETAVLGYPLTTALYVFPFSFLPRLFVGSVIFGCSCGLLAYGLSRDSWWRLGVFTTASFWVALQWMQWAPLILAVSLLPSLLPLVLVKPHLGLPVALTRLTWGRALGCAAFALVSLVVDPTWPIRWLGRTQGYDGFIPLLVLPGPLILLALAKWRQERARFFLLLALMPQRGFYDGLMLFSIPQSAGQLLFLAICSWIGYLLDPTRAGGHRLWVVLSLYMPALLIVLFAPRSKPATAESY